MRLSTPSIQLALVGTLLFTGSACDREITVEDLRIGRQAMPISEVSLMMRGGYSQEAVIADVKRRHIPEKMSVTTEEELGTRGAGPSLIAALKDKNNILTRNQKRAYDDQMLRRASRGTQAAGAQGRDKSAKSSADSEEHRRLSNLQQQQIRNSEQRLAEQADREREQRNSVADRWESIQDQNDNHGTTSISRRYSSPYPTPRRPR